MYISSPTPLNTEKALNSLNKMLSSSHNSRSLLTQCSHTANLSCLYMPQRPWNVLFSDCNIPQGTHVWTQAASDAFRRLSLTRSSSERPFLITASRHYVSSLCPHHFCGGTYNHVPRPAYVYLPFSTSFEPLKDMNHVSVVYLCPPKKEKNTSLQKALSDIRRFMHWSGTTATWPWSTSYKTGQVFPTLSNDFIRTQPSTQRKGNENKRPNHRNRPLFWRIWGSCNY